MMTERKTRTFGNSAKVLAYFEDNINKTVYVEKAAKDIGLPVRTVIATIHTLRAKFGKDAFETVVAGSVWRFVGIGTPTVTTAQATSGDGSSALTYTQVGITQAGVVVAKDVQNNLYQVTPL